MKPWMGVEEAEAAAEAVRSGWVAQGPRVAAFEKALAERVAAPHGVAVSSCTAGLHLALLALDVGPGDEVVVPSLSFIATANVVRQAGADPVFADVDPTTMNLTTDTIEPVMTPRTRAVIAVHQVGMPAQIDDIAALCSRRGVAMVEDAACAIGSMYQGRPVGGLSRLTVFSFHPRKILTTGEGGMVMTDSAELAERITRLRQHGMSIGAYERHEAAGPVIEQYVESGWNYRMTDVQAAIGLVQLAKLDAMVVRRRELAERYRALLGDVSTIALPADPPHGTTNYQSYSVRLLPDHPETVEALTKRLEASGVSPRRGVMAAHLEPAYAGHGHVPLPVTENLTAHTIILPMFHQMTDAQVERVAGLVRSA